MTLSRNQKIGIGVGAVVLTVAGAAIYFYWKNSKKEDMALVGEQPKPYQTEATPPKVIQATEGQGAAVIISTAKDIGAIKTPTFSIKAMSQADADALAIKIVQQIQTDSSTMYPAGTVSPAMSLIAQLKAAGYSFNGSKAVKA